MYMYIGFYIHWPWDSGSCRDNIYLFSRKIIYLAEVLDNTV